MTDVLVRVEGLALIELDELREELPEDAFVNAHQEQRANSDHGELALATAIVVASAAALNALSVWLSRRHQEDPATEITVAPNSDGSVTVRIGAATQPQPKSSTTIDAIRAILDEAVKAAS